MDILFSMSRPSVKLLSYIAFSRSPRLPEAPSSTPPACPVSTQGSLLKVQSAAAHILYLLAKRFPEMKAPAIYNLGTASLRISDVRKCTSAVCLCLRDASLERHLKYIADAADAARHLSEAIVDESVQALAGCLEARTVPAVMPAVRDLLAEHHASYFSMFESDDDDSGTACHVGEPTPVVIDFLEEEVQEKDEAEVSTMMDFSPIAECSSADSSPTSEQPTLASGAPEEGCLSSVHSVDADRDDDKEEFVLLSPPTTLCSWLSNVKTSSANQRRPVKSLLSSFTRLRVPIS